MCNVAFHLGSIYVLFGKQALYYPPLLVLESLGASAYTFGRHRVNNASSSLLQWLDETRRARAGFVVRRQKAGLLVYSRGCWIWLASFGCRGGTGSTAT